MPGRLTTLVKGTFCAGTDTQLGRWVETHDKDKLKAWLHDLENLEMSLEDIGRKWEVIPGTQEDLRHCREFFGNGDGCFFPGFGEALKRGVVRGAFIQGLRISVYQTYESPEKYEEREEAKTVVVYWIAGGPTFEAYVSDSAKEVHVLLITPDPAVELSVPATGRDEPIWLIASPQYAQQIRDRAPHYRYETPEPMPDGLGIECQQIMSY